MESTFAVKITVEQGHRISRIRIQGPPLSVSSVMEQIHDIFSDITMKNNMKAEAERLAKNVNSFKIHLKIIIQADTKFLKKICDREHVKGKISILWIGEYSANNIINKKVMWQHNVVNDQKD